MCNSRGELKLNFYGKQSVMKEKKFGTFQLHDICAIEKLKKTINSAFSKRRKISKINIKSLNFQEKFTFTWKNLCDKFIKIFLPHRFRQNFSRFFTDLFRGFS